MSAETDAGLAALQSGDVAGAVTQLEQATNTDPNDFQACLYLGAAYGQAGRQMDAVTILTKAVQLQPANAQARYNLAVAMESAGYREQALTAAQQAIQLQPDYPKAQEMVSRLSGAPAAPQVGFGAPAPQYGAPPQQTNTVQQAYGQPQTGYGQPQNTQPIYGQPVQGQNPYGAPQAPTQYQPQGAASYGGPPMGAQPQPYGAAPMFQTEAPEANTALILSILGILCCAIMAPISISYAVKARKAIAMNPSLSGGGKATAALVMGIIGTVILGLNLIYLGVVVVAALAQNH